MIIPQNKSYKAYSRVKIEVHILNFFTKFLSFVLGLLSFSKKLYLKLTNKNLKNKKPTSQ